jgi:Holliday junction resolvasome RuvABC DNA-binding subunit
MKELTEYETKRVKTLFELGWRKREIARMVLGSRAEGEEVEMLEAIKKVIPDRYKAAGSERNCSPNSKHQE